MCPILYAMCTYVIINNYLTDTWATCDHQWLVFDGVLLVVEVGKEFLSILIHIGWLLQKTGGQEIIEDLS